MSAGGVSAPAPRHPAQMFLVTFANGRRDGIDQPPIEAMTKRFGIAALIAVGLSHSAFALCEEEFAQLEAQGLPADQLSRNQQWYRQFNSSSVGNQSVVEQDVPRLHLPPSPYNTSALRYADRGAVSACILRHLAESRDSTINFLAHEGYALRLLNGDGVNRNPALAVKYLERAAVSRRYASASYRIAKVQLTGSPTAAMKASGVGWALRALADAAAAPTASEDPGQAIGLLQKVVDDLVDKKQLEEAKQLYRRVEALELPGQPQEKLAAKHKQVRDGSRTASAEELRNSPAVQRFREWDACYWGSGFRTSETPEEWEDTTAIHRHVVERACGKRPGKR